MGAYTATGLHNTERGTMDAALLQWRWVGGIEGTPVFRMPEAQRTASAVTKFLYFYQPLKCARGLARIIERGHTGLKGHVS